MRFQLDNDVSRKLRKDAGLSVALPLTDRREEPGMRTTHSNDRQASPLEMDLWLGRASLAALKVQENVSPSEEEIEAVASLAEYFKARLELISPAHHIQPTVVREKHLREDLEAAFAALAPSAEPPVLRNRPLWEKLASLFIKFARHKSLSRKDAGELLTGIGELVKREVQVPSPKTSAWG